MEDRKLVFDSRIDCRIANPAVFRAAMQLPLNRGLVIIKKHIVMKYNWLCIVFLFFLTDCSKDDKEFLMEAKPYTGNELKINGYYYKKYINEKSLVIIFYANGVQFGGQGYPIPSTEIESTLRDPEFIKKSRNYKDNWSPYEISNHVLRFEFYDYFIPVTWRTCIAHCEILNDTTFNIETITFSKTGKNINESSDFLGEYHFKQFSPKPDSTNTVVK